MKKTLFTFFLSAGSILSFAQTAECGAEKAQQQLIATNSKYAKFAAKISQDWVQYKKQQKLSKVVATPTDTSYEIPIVVHIVHSGEPVGTMFNPSDAAIDSLVDYLNQSWAATWSYYPDTSHGGVRIPIKFVLAKRTPDCNPTTGIVRVDGSILPGYTDYGVNLDYTVPGAEDTAVKDLSIWPGGDYYNIWIVKYIDGPSGATAAAYAYFPGPFYYGGTVIAAEYVYPLSGFPGLYYHAIPHELGHAFALNHTFNGDMGGSICPDDFDCTVDGDEICDTEPHMRIGSGTCAAGTNSCTGLPYNNIQYNIMNYTRCPDRFTKEQRERVMMVLKNFRSGLITSLGATPPSSVAGPKAACTPGAIGNPGNDLDMGPWSVSFGGITTMNFGYTSEGFKEYIDETCLQETMQITAGKSYPIDITTGGAEKVRVWMDYNNDGIFQTTELVFAHDGSFAGETHSGIITVPISGIVTDTVIRMRVVSDDASMTAPTACGALQFGQTEDYSVVIAKAPVGIDEQTIADRNVRIYPNPARNVVYIESDENLTVILQSMDGKIIMLKENAEMLNTESLAKGCYLIKTINPKTGVVGINKLIKD